MHQKQIQEILQSIQTIAVRYSKSTDVLLHIRTTIDEELNQLLAALNPRFEQPVRECLRAVLRNLVNQAVRTSPGHITSLFPVFALMCADSQDTFADVDWSLLG